MTNETLAERVYRLRKALDISQDELSKRAGVSAAHVYQVEAGKRWRLQLDKATGYAEALLDAMPEEARDDPVNYLLFGVLKAPAGEAPRWAYGLPDLNDPENLTMIRAQAELLKERELREEQRERGGARRGMRAIHAI